MQGFDDLLRAKIRVSGRSLASLVHETGIPKSTINNWQHGVVASPRDWRGILRLAAALHLDRADTDRLLVAADHSPLAELRAAHTSDEESRFAPWSAELRRTTPLQAPRGCAVFVNRESELASLAAHLETGGTTVVIEGMTGAGKSELAIRTATRLRNHYPDGIAWDELGATTLEATIAALAHGFGIPLDPKTSTPSRAATLRSALAGLRCLLVFDGVEDTLAVEALLPPKGSRYSVILTTQVATTATRLGAARITLEGFDASESASIDLYQEVLGGHRVSAQQPVFEQIAADCGYLPLALAITAWQLEAGLLQPEDLRTLLGSRRKIDSLTFGPVAIRTVLALATGHLSEDARALLQVISIFPCHDTDADAIAAVARIEPYRARQIAAELQARSLLLFGRQPSRYRLHTLVRDFVSDGFDATELQARLVHTIVVSAEQHRYDSYWFADEESHFEGVLQLAKLLDATEWRVRGVLAMTPYWVQSGQLPRARTHLADVLEPARSLDAPELCARVHRWLAHVEDKLGNLDHAIALASEGLATLEGRDHPDTVCALKVTLAGIWISQNKLDEGGRLLSEALASAREHGFSNRICDALLNLGFIAREQGQLEAARGYYVLNIKPAT
ncbi:MAG: hypothetical protein KDC98_24855, partial [Planctomycetes bacterium]|nr:hypothetical protein [Planctomycetota bacterium]